MAYEPHTWQNDEVITAERMNALEQGVANEQVGPQGPKGDTGETGPQGPEGKKVIKVTPVQRVPPVQPVKTERAWRPFPLPQTRAAL